MRNINLTKANSNLFYFYLCFLSFIFLFQVLSGTNKVVFLLGLVASVLLVFTAFEKGEKSRLEDFKKYRRYPLYFLVGSISYSTLVTHLYEEDFVNLARHFVYYIIPVFLGAFFLLRKVEVSAYANKFISYLLILGVIFSLFQLYIFTGSEPRIIEHLFFDYMFENNGRLMGEFLGSYRPNGIAEHIHVTGMFLGLSFVLWSLELFNNPILKNYIFTFLVLLGFMCTGVRLSMITTFSSMFFLVFYKAGEFRLSSKKQLSFLCFSIFSCLLLIYLFIPSTHHFVVIYLNPFQKFSFLPEGITLGEVVVVPAVDQVMNFFSFNSLDEFIKIFVGYGFETKDSIRKNLNNDDLFAVQILTNFGLFGFISFYLSLILGLKLSFRLFSSNENFYYFIFLLMFFVSTFHSGIIFKRMMFPIFSLTLFFTYLAYERQEEL